MKHLKRFKNWFVVVYYACWKVSEQVRLDLQSNEPAANAPGLDDQVKLDDAKVELEAKTAAQPSELVEVAKVQASVQPQPAKKVEEVSTKDQAPKAPAAEVKTTKPELNAKQVQQQTVQQPVPPPARAQKLEAAPAVKVTPNPTEQQSSNGKYQPGAINDQTAQRLARLLVSEIKLYQKSKTEGAPESEMNNIYDLLRDPIEKSRQHYKQRMGAQAIESMPDYFHSELVRALCGGDASRLGANYPSERS